MLKFWRNKLFTAVSAKPGARAAEPSVLAEQPEVIGRQLEIVHLLREVCDEQAPALISLGGQDDGVTTVLEVGQQADVLVFAGLPDAGLTRKFLQSQGPFMVSTSCDQVYLMFEVDALEKTDYFGRPALKSRLPKTVTYMQRRDAFRIVVPSDKGVTCTILQAGAAVHPTAGKLAVRDLSAVGLALADPARVLDAGSGKTYEARLDIPRMGAFDVTLSAVHVADEEPAHKGAPRMRRVGCAFVDMPRSVLIRIQSFVGGLQREEIMRQRGLL